MKNNFFNSSFDQEQTSLSNREEAESFARTTNQLKERLMRNLGTFIDYQKRRYRDVLTTQTKEQILNSYEIKLREFENQYLYQMKKESLFLLQNKKIYLPSMFSKPWPIV